MSGVVMRLVMSLNTTFALVRSRPVWFSIRTSVALTPTLPASSTSLVVWKPTAVPVSTALVPTVLDGWRAVTVPLVTST